MSDPDQHDRYGPEPSYKICPDCRGFIGDRAGCITNGCPGQEEPEDYQISSPGIPENSPACEVGLIGDGPDTQQVCPECDGAGCAAGVPGTLPPGYTLTGEDVVPSSEYGSWKCNACGFQGFWRGVHCMPGAADGVWVGDGEGIGSHPPMTGEEK